MSTLKTNNVQVGQSVTATNNFTLYQPTSPDGTVRLGNGNSGSTTDVASFTSAGLFQFNSGYGSVATAYGCRAWVNFNGTGTVAIRASGNVSSITDAGTGQYTVNFTTAMPDTNYATVGSGYTAASGAPAFTDTKRSVIAFSNTSSSCRIQVYRTDINSLDADSSELNVAIFR